MKIVALSVAVVLVLWRHALADPNYPVSVVTDEDKGQWIKGEVERIGEPLLKLLTRRPLPEREINEAAQRLQALEAPCEALWVRGKWCNANVIAYYTDQIDAAFAGLRRRRAVEAAEVQNRRAVEAKRLPKEQEAKMLERKVWIGMPADLLRLSWGAPSRMTSTTSAGGTIEIWWYGSSQYVTLVNARVTSITQSR